MPARTIARGRDGLVTATPETSVAELGRIVAEKAVGSVIIVDDEPVGIVTDRDLPWRSSGTDATSRPRPGT